MPNYFQAKSTSLRYIHSVSLTSRREIQKI